MTERIEKIKIDALIPFENHPFKERTGEEQAELVESIRTTGMLVPVIVRPLLRGKYEIISGHRRVAACRELGDGGYTKVFPKELFQQRYAENNHKTIGELAEKTRTQRKGGTMMNDKFIGLEHSDIFPFQYEANKPTIHKIGGRYFEVSSRFDDKGTESVLHQFIELLKQENLI